MTFLALINPRIWVALALAAALTGLAWWTYDAVYDRGAASVQKRWEADKLAVAQAQVEALAKVNATAKNLQIQADTLRRTKNAQIDRLNTELASAVNSLQNRPPRPSSDSVPSVATVGAATSCTGAELHREDAQFLTRESDRAERLRIDLGQCQTAYSAAREAVSK